VEEHAEELGGELAAAGDARPHHLPRDVLRPRAALLVEPLLQPGRLRRRGAHDAGGEHHQGDHDRDQSLRHHLVLFTYLSIYLAMC